MTFRFAMASFLSLALALATGVAAENIESGPQVGKRIPGPFHPLNLTGAKAGQKNCLVCQNGTNPVAMIFARDVSEPLATLIKKVDAATAKNKNKQMGSFVVFLSDSEQLPKKVKDLAAKTGVKECVLSIDNAAGPQGYNVSKDAEVTVVLYTKQLVKANYAFKKGELKDKDIDQIVSDIGKILPLD